MPDIQGRRKGLAALGVLLLAVGFAAGYGLARRTPGPPLAPRDTVNVASVKPPEIRIDPSTVRLADTALHLRELPPPPEQNVTGGEENP